MATATRKAPVQTGFKAKPNLTREQLDHAARIDCLFDAMRDELGMDTRTVFRTHADMQHFEFLQNVRSCPAAVEQFCREALAPNSEMRQRAAIVNHQKKPKAA